MPQWGRLGKHAIHTPKCSDSLWSDLQVLTEMKTTNSSDLVKEFGPSMQSYQPVSNCTWQPSVKRSRKACRLSTVRTKHHLFRPPTAVVLQAALRENAQQLRMKHRERRLWKLGPWFAALFPLIAVSISPAGPGQLCRVWPQLSHRKLQLLIDLMLTAKAWQLLGLSLCVIALWKLR